MPAGPEKMLLLLFTLFSTHFSPAVSATPLLIPFSCKPFRRGMRRVEDWRAGLG